jgi:peptidoglycan hydrolase CwlO-like protein
MKFSDFLLLVVACLIIYNVSTLRKIKTNIALYNQKIDSIQKEIDSVQFLNKGIDNKIGVIDGEIGKVDGHINSVNKNITIIQNQTHEKVSAVNDYTVHDLNLFFSNRYEGHDSTIKDTSSKVSH